MQHFNELTPADAERLACLAEEAGEIVQAVGKILRHGYESCHPDYVQWSNRAELMREIGDLVAVAGIMVASGDLENWWIERAIEEKPGRMWPFMHHQHVAPVESADSQQEARSGKAATGTKK